MSARLDFDWAATNPLRPEARAALLEALDEGVGNASSAHAAGRRARALVQSARRAFAAALGAQRDDVFFLGSGSEANLVALEGALAAGEDRCPHVLASAVEHPSVLEPLRRLEARGAIELELIPVDARGRVDPAGAAARLRPTTRLVSVMLANHEVGTLQPVAAIAAALAAARRERPPLLHCDATQACGKLPTSLTDLGADLLVVTPHKFGGPRGVGVLARRAGVRLATPLSPGRQEQGLRGGTEDVAAIHAAAAALGAALATREATAARLAAGCARLTEGLARALPDASFHSDPQSGAIGIVNLSLPDLRGEWLVAALDLRGVAVSHGAACASLASLPSHVLVAMGAADRAANSLRISFGGSTSDADLDSLVGHVRAAVVQLRLR